LLATIDLEIIQEDNRRIEMRGVYYRTEKDGTPLATPELRISATNNRTVYYDNQNAKEAALQNDEIKEGSIVLTGYADGESEVVIKQQPDWENKEAITAAQINAGYTAPADGMIVGYMTTDVIGHKDVTINGVVIATAYYNTTGGGDTSFASIEVVVKKGDILKSTNIYANDTKCSFVPFKTVAEPLTLPVNVMNNPSLPDWGRAVAITAAQLQAGYVCPNNGFIVGNGAGTSAVTELSINNVICAVGTYAGGTYVRLNICATVQSGNIVKTSANLNTVCQISFVPFKN
jgi:hypothetical protein